MSGIIKCCGFAKKMLMMFGSDGLIRKYRIMKIGCIAAAVGAVTAAAAMAALFYLAGAKFGVPSCICRYIDAGCSE